MIPQEFYVRGLPAPQGSKRGFVRGARAVLVESSAKVRPWREAVVAAAVAALEAGVTSYPRGVPLMVSLRFHVPRPKSHYGTGRNATRLKPTAPAFPTTMPDLDKLVRSTLDALTTAGMYRDDSQVTKAQVAKRYVAEPGELTPFGLVPVPWTVPGARIGVYVDRWN